MNEVLRAWALKWMIPVAALDDLGARLTASTMSESSAATGLSEAGVASHVRLAEAQVGNRIWRNNVGAAQTEDGRHLRYGLCNESAKMNKAIKSSDFVGIYRHPVTLTDVGKTLGVFYAIETKRRGWRYSGDEHEAAQLAFLTLVNSLGGIGKFTTGEEYEKQ